MLPPRPPISSPRAVDGRVTDDDERNPADNVATPTRSMNHSGNPGPLFFSPGLSPITSHGNANITNQGTTPGFVLDAFGERDLETDSDGSSCPDMPDSQIVPPTAGGQYNFWKSKLFGNESMNHSMVSAMSVESEMSEIIDRQAMIFPTTAALFERSGNRAIAEGSPPKHMEHLANESSHSLFAHGSKEYMNDLDNTFDSEIHFGHKSMVYPTNESLYKRSSQHDSSARSTEENEYLVYSPSHQKSGPQFATTLSPNLLSKSASYLQHHTSLQPEGLQLRSTAMPATYRSLQSSTASFPSPLRDSLDGSARSKQRGLSPHKRSTELDQSVRSLSFLGPPPAMSASTPTRQSSNRISTRESFEIDSLDLSRDSGEPIAPRAGKPSIPHYLMNSPGNRSDTEVFLSHSTRKRMLSKNQPYHDYYDKKYSLPSPAGSSAAAQKGIGGDRAYASDDEKHHTSVTTPYRHTQNTQSRKNISREGLGHVTPPSKFVYRSSTATPNLNLTSEQLDMSAGNLVFESFLQDFSHQKGSLGNSIDQLQHASFISFTAEPTLAEQEFRSLPRSLTKSFDHASLSHRRTPQKQNSSILDTSDVYRSQPDVREISYLLNSSSPSAKRHANRSFDHNYHRDYLEHSISQAAKPAARLPVHEPGGEGAAPKANVSSAGGLKVGSIYTVALDGSGVPVFVPVMAEPTHETFPHPTSFTAKSNTAFTEEPLKPQYSSDPTSQPDFKPTPSPSRSAELKFNFYNNIDHPLSPDHADRRSGVPVNAIHRTISPPPRQHGNPSTPATLIDLSGVLDRALERGSLVQSARKLKRWENEDILGPASHTSAGIHQQIRATPRTNWTTPAKVRDVPPSGGDFTADGKFSFSVGVDGQEHLVPTSRYFKDRLIGRNFSSALNLDQ